MKFGTEIITYRSPQVWNLTPGNIKDVTSLENFKREIKNWKGEKCPCRICTCKIFAVSKRKWCWTSKKLAVFYKSIQLSEAYSEPNWVSKMMIFAYLICVFDVWVGSEYTCMSFYNWILSLLYVGWDQYWLAIYITIVYFSTLHKVNNKINK